jgi:hypothetical protein
MLGIKSATIAFIPGKKIVMTYVSSEKCEAKDRGKCRFHRSGAFAETAVSMYMDANSGYDKKVQERLVSLKPVLLEYSDRLYKKIESGIKDKTFVLNNSRVARPLIRLNDKVLEEMKNDGIARNERFDLRELASFVLMQTNRVNRVNRAKEVNVFGENSKASTFDKSAGHYLAEKGGFVDPYSDNYYGSWEKRGVAEHIKSCGIAFMGTPQEDTWHQFAGTFADDDRSHGMSAEVECNCGTATGKLRIEGEFTDITRELVNTYSVFGTSSSAERRLPWDY